MRRQRGAKLSATPLFLVVFLLAFVDAHTFLQSTNVAPTMTTTSSSSQGFRNEIIKTCLAMMGGDNNNNNNIRNEGLNIAVVGAGPSGLLLSHFLRNDDGNCKNSVTLFDVRSDPRTNKLEGRAYALGVGIRGRTAIHTADPVLWEAVKSRGYESERFKLHLGISDTKDLVIPLRSDSKPSKGSSSSSSIVEPSLLIYQSELCASLLEELEEGQQMNKNGFLEIHFDTRVVDCDLNTMMIRALPSNYTNTASTANASSADADAEAATTISEFGPFDLIVGCDGVNSRVRASIDQIFPEFATTRKKLPGFFKVVRLGYPVGTTSEDGSNAYDPKAVSLLIPSGAFIEPTGDDGSCCILFTGRGSGGDGDISGLPLYLRETKNITAVMDALRTTFPRWKEESFRDIAEQLVTQSHENNSAYSVTCNTYHYQDKAVLVGDAAHATGGVSGQGVNSALVDALVLAESLQQQPQSADLEGSLLEYSMRQVPEGRALYDLSFGPKPNGLKKKVLWGLKNARDALFGGRLGIGEKALQTRLSSELTSFAEIRRERDYFYENGDDPSFPSDDEFRRQLEALHNIKKQVG